jgi:hypothetical protein
VWITHSPTLGHTKIRNAVAYNNTMHTIQHYSFHWMEKKFLLYVPPVLMIYLHTRLKHTCHQLGHIRPCLWPTALVNKIIWFISNWIHINSLPLHLLIQIWLVTILHNGSQIIFGNTPAPPKIVTTHLNYATRTQPRTAFTITSECKLYVTAHFPSKFLK